MARGKRPDPFRTRKLSLPAPMVLPRRRGGRVGRRRTTIPEGAPAPLGPLRRFWTPDAHEAFRLCLRTRGWLAIWRFTRCSGGPLGKLARHEARTVTYLCWLF